MVAEIGNLLLTFMSAWIVGKVEAPAKANIMEPNAEMFWMNYKKEKSVFQPLKNPSADAEGNVFSGNSVPSIIQVTTMRRQAIIVVIRAPTAIGQKSLGVPIQVSGVRPPATMTIQTQRESVYPAAMNRDCRSWEMRTMKTQPPP